MELQERERASTAVAVANPRTAGVGDATRTRQTGEDFLAAADEAITRGLATDSTTFLESTLQEGGQ